jgi:hypothetical protein
MFCTVSVYVISSLGLTVMSLPDAPFPAAVFVIVRSL